MIVSDIVDDSPEFATMVEQSEEMYSSLLAGEMTSESILTSDTMATVKLELDKKKTELRGRSKTSQLWLNYQKMLHVARSCTDHGRSYRFLAYALKCRFRLSANICSGWALQLFEICIFLCSRNE